MMYGYWVTNTHKIRVAVADWDDKDALVSPTWVEQCFLEPCTQDHNILLRTRERLIPRYALEDSSGRPLLRYNTAR